MATIAVTGPSDALLAPQEEKETIRCEKLVTAAAAAEQNLARKIDAPNQLFLVRPRNTGFRASLRGCPNPDLQRVLRAILILNRVEPLGLFKEGVVIFVKHNRHVNTAQVMNSELG